MNEHEQDGEDRPTGVESGSGGVRERAAGGDVAGPGAPAELPLPRLVPPPDPTHGYTRRAFMFVGGVALFVVGTVLWLTPVVTGALPFWVAGLVLMGAAHRRIGQLVNRAERRLPLKLRRALRWRPGRKRREAAAARALREDDAA